MIKQYYKLSKEQSQILLDDYHNVATPLVEHRSNLINEFKDTFGIQGEEMVQEQSFEGSTKVIGYTIGSTGDTHDWIIVNEFQDGPFTKQYAIPNKKYKRGKEFANWLSKINNVSVPTFSKYVLDELLIEDVGMVFDNMNVSMSVAGYHNSIIVLSIPLDEPGDVEFNDDYEIEQIKKSEFIHITEEMTDESN